MTCHFDRAAIMRDAWGRFRDGKRLGLGWTFGRCLRVAWTAAKLRAEFPPERYGDPPAPKRLTGATSYHFPAALP